MSPTNAHVVVAEAGSQRLHPIGRILAVVYCCPASAWEGLITAGQGEGGGLLCVHRTWIALFVLASPDHHGGRPISHLPYNRTRPLDQRQLLTAFLQAHMFLSDARRPRVNNN